MRRASLILILALAVSPAFAAEIHFVVPMVAVPTPQPVPQVVPIGSVLDIDIADIDAAAAKRVAVVYYPRPAGIRCKPVTNWEGKNFQIEFCSPVAGKYLLWLGVPPTDAAGKVLAAEIEVTVGDAPNPPNPPNPPPVPPGPPPPPTPPAPPPLQAPTLLLITADGDWCPGCKAVKADTLPGLTAAIGSRLSVVDYTNPAAKQKYPESVLVPRWVLTRPDGTTEKKIGYLTLDQVNAWLGGAK